MEDWYIFLLQDFVYFIAIVYCIIIFFNGFYLFYFYFRRNMNVTENPMRIWLGSWLICREEWNKLK